jgi:hypothetical protein
MTKSRSTHISLILTVDFKVPEARWNKARSDAKQSSGISKSKIPKPRQG